MAHFPHRAWHCLLGISSQSLCPKQAPHLPLPSSSTPPHHPTPAGGTSVLPDHHLTDDTSQPPASAHLPTFLAPGCHPFCGSPSFPSTSRPSSPGSHACGGLGELRGSHTEKGQARPLPIPSASCFGPGCSSCRGPSLLAPCRNLSNLQSLPPTRMTVFTVFISQRRSLPCLRFPLWVGPSSYFFPL